MKRSTEESDIIGMLDVWEKTINEPFTCMSGMLFFNEEKQREAHARGKAFAQAEFDKAARALAMIHVKRHRKKFAAAQRYLAARATAKSTAVPPVTTVAVPETPACPTLQSPSGT